MSGRPAPLRSLDPSTFFPGNTALFLDFDGTLVEIVDRPEAVTVKPSVHRSLARLQENTGGALAIVTGRPIGDIDRFLAPLKPPAAGVHGLERRAASGRTVTAPIDAPMLEELHRRLSGMVDAEPGLMLEVKTGSMALHYRRRPELERRCLEAVEKIVAALDGLEVLRGKMVVEIKAGRSTKGDAIAAFMEEPPFRGRLPLFAGDDRTDEDAFAEIARLNGVSIKIGAGETRAAFRARGIAQFHRWLADLVAVFGTERQAG